MLADLSQATSSGSAAVTALNRAMSDQCHLDCELALAHLSIDWSFEVRAGDPSRELVRTVRDRGARWLVVGCSVRRRVAARHLAKSMPDQLAATAGVPVIVVPAGR